MTEFKDVKQSIVAAQLASTPKDKVVSDIMKGSMTEFKDIKQAIVETQLAATPKDKIVNDVMKGSTELVNLPNHYSGKSI